MIYIIDNLQEYSAHTIYFVEISDKMETEFTIDEIKKDLSFLIASYDEPGEVIARCQTLDWCSEFKLSSLTNYIWNCWDRTNDEKKPYIIRYSKYIDFSKLIMLQKEKISGIYSVIEVYKKCSDGRDRSSIIAAHYDRIKEESEFLIFLEELNSKLELGMFDLPENKN